MAPNACPFRRDHEWDEDGLCRHCYAQRPENDVPSEAVTPPHGITLRDAQYEAEAQMMRTVASLTSAVVASGTAAPLVPAVVTGGTWLITPQADVRIVDNTHTHDWVAYVNADAVHCRHCLEKVSGMQMLQSNETLPPQGLESPEGQAFISRIFKASTDKK